MPYQTGIASGPGNFIDLMAAFLSANGWNVDAQSGSGDDRELYINDGADLFVSILTTANQINWHANRGYSAAADVDNQPGLHPEWNNTCGRTEEIQGPYTGYHFFLDQSGPDGDRFHIAIEQQADMFRFFSMGTLKKSGTWDGGQYLTVDGNDGITAFATRLNNLSAFANGTEVSTAARNAVFMGGIDGVAGSEWLTNALPFISHGVNSRRFGFNIPLGGFYPTSIAAGGDVTMRASYSSFWPLKELSLWISRPINQATTDAISIAGTVPNIYSINMKEYAPKQIIDIGGTDYIILPNGRKATTNNTAIPEPNAGLAGWAINIDI